MTQNSFNQFIGHLNTQDLERQDLSGFAEKTPDQSLLPAEVDQETFLEVLAAKSASRLPEGLTPVTGKQLQDMQAFGRRWRKRHPLGTQEQMENAIKGFFNLKVVKETPANAE